MRKVYFPMMNENPEILDYLLGTVLRQTGSLTLDYADHTIEIFLIADPYDNWNSNPVYCAAVTRGKILNKRVPARYYGFTTTDEEELLTFIQDYDVDEERYKEKCYKRRHAKKMRPDDPDNYIKPID